MSSTPAQLDLDPHVSGTTWAQPSMLVFRVETLDDDDEVVDDVPLDLTGADARMVFRDELGAIVWDWHLSDDEKPGLRMADDPTTGVLYIDGPGVLEGAAGVMHFDLKVTLASGEVAVDVGGSVLIIEGITP